MTRKSIKDLHKPTRTGSFQEVVSSPGSTAFGEADFLFSLMVDVLWKWQASFTVHQHSLLPCSCLQSPHMKLQGCHKKNSDLDFWPFHDTWIYYRHTWQLVLCICCVELWQMHSTSPSQTSSSLLQAPEEGRAWVAARPRTPSRTPTGKQNGTLNVGGLWAQGVSCIFFLLYAIWLWVNHFIL